MRAAQVSGGLVRTSLAVAMQYRSDFVMDALTGILRAFGAIAPIGLVFGHVPEVMGWTAHEVVLVVGLFFLMQAVLAGLVEPNLGEIVEAIRKGTLDFLLLKPADAQLLASARRIAPGRLWDAVVAALLIGWAFTGMPAPSVADVAAAVVFLCAGIAAMYGVWLLAICTSFWLVKVDNLRYLLWSAADAGRWPLDVFSRWIQVGLVVVVPVGILTTFPAMALRGDWSVSMLAAGCAVAVGFLVVSRLAWKAALASYTSASS